MINEKTDLKEGIVRWRLWGYLGLLDNRLKYKRTILGPWWITLTFFITIASMGFVFSKLFGQDPRAYLPFLCTGMLVWNFLTAALEEGMLAFGAHRAYILQLSHPYSTAVLRVMSRQILIAGHNLLAIFLVLFYCGVPLRWGTLLAIPGFLLMSITVFWMTLLVAVMSTRYCDVGQMVSSILRVLFFVTPITWMPKMFPPDFWLVKFNPFAYLIAIVRAPLLEQTLHWHDVGVVCSLCVGLYYLASRVFRYCRNDIPFWV